MKAKLFVAFDVVDDEADISAVIDNIKNTQGNSPFVPLTIIRIPVRETGTIGQRAATIIKQDFGVTEPAEAIACIIDEVIADDVCERMVEKMRADLADREAVPPACEGCAIQGECDTGEGKHKATCSERVQE